MVHHLLRVRYNQNASTHGFGMPPLVTINPIWQEAPAPLLCSPAPVRSWNLTGMIDSMQGYMQAHAPLPVPHGHNIRHTGGREFNMCSCTSSNSSGPSCLFKRCTSCVLKAAWHTGSVARASLSCASAQETDLQHCSMKLAGALSRHSAQSKDHTKASSLSEM